MPLSPKSDKSGRFSIFTLKNIINPNKDLINKKAVFECKVLTIKQPEEVKINDDFAKNLGAKDLTNLKELISKQINDEFKKMLISKIPSGDLGTGEDVSNCVAFLASDMANYINGETIHVNGGMYMA